MQYRPPNAYQEVSNINHFGSVSDSLGRLAAGSQYMASNCKLTAASLVAEPTAVSERLLLGVLAHRTSSLCRHKQQHAISCTLRKHSHTLMYV